MPHRLEQQAVCSKQQVQLLPLPWVGQLETVTATDGTQPSPHVRFHFCISCIPPLGPSAAALSTHMCHTSTAIWAGVLVLQQYLVLGVITLLSKFHLKQSARAPQLSQTVMFFEATLGYIGWAWPTGLYAAWLNPGAPGSFSWGYGPPRFFFLLGFCLFTLITYGKL